VLTQYLCCPYILGLQVGRYGPELFDFSAERVARSVVESLDRLQTPYIDLIQCHDIEFGDLDQVRSELSFESRTQYCSIQYMQYEWDP
jgi:aryl-alcohol dehydrogenase-like predicted oxidoreductase